VGAHYRVHGQNNYEQASCRIDMNQLRQTMHYADCTHRYVQHYACNLGLVAERGQDGDLSVAALGNRFISFKLAPADHPYAVDSNWRLLRLGTKAALQRFDVSWPMRLLFAAWFVVMAGTPGRLARSLAEMFVYPERRRALNRVLGGLHRS
jgi:hypothetical protein